MPKLRVKKRIAPDAQDGEGRPHPAPAGDDQPDPQRLRRDRGPCRRPRSSSPAGATARATSIVSVSDNGAGLQPARRRALLALRDDQGIGPRPRPLDLAHDHRIAWRADLDRGSRRGRARGSASPCPRRGAASRRGPGRLWPRVARGCAVQDLHVATERYWLRSGHGGTGKWPNLGFGHCLNSSSMIRTICS